MSILRNHIFLSKCLDLTIFMTNQWIFNRTPVGLPYCTQNGCTECYRVKQKQQEREKNIGACVGQFAESVTTVDIIR